MSNKEQTRRSVLRGAAFTATGLAFSGKSGANPVVDERFEEREWGYVRRDFEPPGGTGRPTVFSIDGYQGASEAGAPTHYVRMRDDVLVAVHVGEQVYPSPFVDDRYVPVQASLRGTGCSGGRFDYMDRVHAYDGYELIEWLADRPWSLDRVGMFGRSFSGMTAFMIASTQPPSLAAMCSNALIADLYRDIVFPGGVPNNVFTTAFVYGLRPAQDVAGTAVGIGDADPLCAQNTATREPNHPADEEAVWYTRREDDTEWQLRALITWADRIEVPTYMTHAFQDEQTGPRGTVELFEAIDPEPASPPGTPGVGRGRPPVHDSPKLLRAMNGFHGRAGGFAQEEAQAFFDYWLLGEETGIMDEPPIRLFLNQGAEASETTAGMDGWPDSNTDWRTLYLDEDGALSTDPPSTAGADTYLTGSPRRSHLFDTDEPAPAYEDGPDQLVYRGPAFDEPTLLAGPTTATLFVESTTVDMDLFVVLADEDPEGRVTPLQRGLLRASHRAIDEDRSWYTDDGDLVRPYRPHTNPTEITPGETYRYDVEIWPVGHLLYPGHRLQVVVHTPPVLDSLWGYEASRQPGVNQVHRSDEHPSRVVVPTLPWEGALPPKPDCGEPEGYRCLE